MSGEVIDVNYQTAKTFICDGYDSSYNELTFEVVSNPLHGSLGSFTNNTATTGHDTASIVYTPTSGYSGPDSWSYRTKNGSTPTSNYYDFNATTYAGGSASNVFQTILPAGTYYGDLMIAVVVVDGAVDTDAIVPPTNWKIAHRWWGDGVTNTDLTVVVYWKIAHEHDIWGTTRNWNLPATYDGWVGMFTYKNVSGAVKDGTPIFNVTGQAFAAGQTCNLTGLDVPTNGGVFAIFVTDSEASSWTGTPSGFTKRLDFGSNFEPHWFDGAIFDKIQAGGGNTGTISATHNGSGGDPSGLNGSVAIAISYQISNGPYSEPATWNLNVKPAPQPSVQPILSLAGRSIDQTLGQKEIVFHAKLDQDDPNRVNPIYFAWATSDTDVGTTAEGRGGINLLSNSGFEVDTSGWAAGSNCSIARTTSQHNAGVASLQMTATAGGDMIATTSTGTSGFAVKPGKRYAPNSKFRANTTARACQTQIRFFDAAGADLGVGSNVSAGITDSNSAWTADAGIGVSGSEAPAGAKFGAVEVVVKAAAASEVHYVDEVTAVCVLDYYRGYHYGVLQPGETHFACPVVLTGNATYSMDKHIVVQLLSVSGGDGGNAPVMGTASANLNLRKFVVNTAPWPIPVQTHTNKNTDVTVRLIGRDTSTADLTFSWGTGLNGGSVTSNTPGTGRKVKGTTTYYEDYVDVVFHPATNFTGMEAFAFTVNDGTFTSNPAIVNIAVGDTPATPLFSINDRSIDAAFGDDVVTMDVKLSAASKSDTFFKYSTDATGAYPPNGLNANQADVETDATGWGSTTNCSLTRTTAQFRTGAGSLQMTSSASGNMSAKNNALSTVPVTAGKTVTAWAWFRAATSTRNVQVNLSWRDSSTALITTTTGSSTANTTSGWTQRTVTGTAPTNAAYVAVEVVVNSTGAASEVHYVDNAYISVGAVSFPNTPGIGIIAMENESYQTMGLYGLDQSKFPKVTNKSGSTPLISGGLLSRGVLFTHAYAPRGSRSHQCYVDLVCGASDALGVLTDGMSTTGGGISAGGGGSIPWNSSVVPADNLLTQLDKAGMNWYAYAEGKPSDVTTGNVTAPGGNGPNYLGRHFAPVADWKALNNGHSRVKDAGSTVGFGGGTPSWSTLMTDLNSTSNPVDFFWFSPTPANQGHKGSGGEIVPTTGNWRVANSSDPVDADAFLDKIVNDIMGTAWYKAGGVLIIWWDEADGSAGTTSIVDSAGQQKPVFVISKAIEAQAERQESTKVNDWGFLRDLEDFFGLTPLGKAADGGIDAVKTKANIGKGVLKKWIELGKQNAEPYNDYVPVTSQPWVIPAGLTTTKIPVSINPSNAVGSPRTIRVIVDPASVTNATGVTNGNLSAKLTIRTDTPIHNTLANGCMVGFHDPKSTFYGPEEKFVGKPFAAIRYYFSPDDWKSLPGSHKFIHEQLSSPGRLCVVSHMPPRWKTAELDAAGNPVFTGINPANNKYAWKEIADNQYEGYLRNLARAYKNYNREIIVIFNHEPYDNSTQRTKEHPVDDPARGSDAEFKAAFQKFVTMFEQEGARKGFGGKVWIGYCKAIDAGEDSPSKDLMYPGHKYVDIFCPDGYNWHAPSNTKRWEEAKDIFGPYVKEAAELGFPVFIAETGCLNSDKTIGKSRDVWFDNFGKWLKTDPYAAKVVKGFAYFHMKSDGHEWKFMKVDPNTLAVTKLGDGISGWTRTFCHPDQSYFTHESFSLVDVNTNTTESGLVVDDVQVIEGVDANALFRVTLDPASTSSVSVNYATLQGTAAPSTDYTTTTGTLNFSAGEKMKTVTVPILLGGTGEGEYEEFFLQLSSPSGATLVRDTAICSIKESVTPGSVTTNIIRNAVAKTSTGTAGTSSSVTVPAGIVNGDLLVAFITCQANVTITATGWALVKDGITTDTTSAGCRTAVYKKTANNEVGSWSFTYSASTDSAVIVAAYGNVDSVTPIANSDFVKGDLSPDSDILAPGMQGSLAGQILVCGFGMNPSSTAALTFLTPSGMDYIESADPGAGTTNQAVLALFEQVVPYSSFEPKVCTITGDDGGKNIGISLLLNQKISTVAPSTISLRATASTQYDSGAGTHATIVVNKPTGTVDGDVMLAGITVRSSISVTAPAGWTQIADQLTTTVSNAGSRTTVFRKVAASEGSTYTFTYSSTVDDGACAVILSYIGVDNTTPEDATATSVQTDTTTDTTINIPAITTVTDNAWHVYFAGVNPLTTSTTAVTGSQSAGYTEDYDSTIKSDGIITLRNSLSVGHKAITPAGATTAFDVTTTNDGRNTGISVALRPGTTTTGTPNTITYRAGSQKSDVQTAGGVTSIAVPKPSSPSALADKDVMLAFITIQGDADVSSAPSGWSTVRSADTTASGTANNGDCRVHTYKKVVTSAAGEPSTYTWNFTTGCDVAVAIVAYYGVDNTTPVDTSGATLTTSSSLTITSPSITPQVANEMLVMGHGHNPDTGSTATITQTPSTGLTKRVDTATKASGINSNYNRATVAVFDLVGGSAGVAMGTHTSTVTDHGENIGVAVLLKPSNATGGAPPPPPPPDNGGNNGGGGGGVPTPPPPNVTPSWDASSRSPFPINVSGLAASETYPGTIWGHGTWRDAKAGKAYFWCLKETAPGSFLFNRVQFRLTAPGGVDIHINDWEDAAYTVENGQGYIWIVDHGFYNYSASDTDQSVRNGVTNGGMIYKIKEPSPDTAPGADGVVAVAYDKLFKYNLVNYDTDPNHWTSEKTGNVEAMFAFNGQLFLIGKMDKDAPGGSDVFALPANLVDGTGVTVNNATQYAKINATSLSAADFSWDNKFLMTYQGGKLEVRQGDGSAGSLKALLASKPIYTNTVQTSGFAAEGGCWFPRRPAFQRNFLLGLQAPGTSFDPQDGFGCMVFKQSK